MTLKSYSFQTTHPDTNAVIQLDFEAWQGAGAAFVRQADLTSFNIRDLSGRQINFDTLSLDAQTTLGNAAKNFTAYKSLVDQLGIRPEQFVDYLGERYPGGAGNTVSTSPFAQTLENFFVSFGIDGAERVVKGGFQPISAAATVIEGIADAKRDGIQNYANVQAEAVANIVLSDVNRDQLLALYYADAGIGMELRGKRGSSEILAGNGYEIDALRAGIGLQIEAWKLEAAAKQLKFEDVLPDKLSLLAIAGLAFPPTALPSSIYLAAEGLDTALKIAKQSVGNAVLDDLLDAYALKVNDAQKAKLAAVAQPGWADGIAAVVDDPSPTVTGATIVSQSNSDPELAALLPPLPDRKPDIFGPPIPAKKPESPSDGEEDNEPTLEETGPNLPGGTPVGGKVYLDEPAPLSVSHTSLDGVAITRVFGPDRDGDGRPDSFLEHRSTDDLQSTTLNYIVGGKLKQDILNVTIFGENPGEKYGSGLTDIFDLATPDLRSSVSQLALEVFSDTVLENIVETAFLKTRGPALPAWMSFADAAELAASDKVKYVTKSGVSQQSLPEEFFANGISRFADLSAAWVASKVEKEFDLDKGKLADQLISTIASQTVKSGVVLLGSIAESGLSQTGQIALPTANDFFTKIGSATTSAATSAGVAFLLNEFLGDLGAQPETQEAALAVGISQSIVGLSGLATSIATAFGLASWTVPIIGPILAFGAGKILTPIFNKFFGHDDTIALAVIRADLADNRIEVGQVTEDDGGSKKFAAAQARSVTDLINAIIELGDATITKYAAYKIGHTDDIPIGGPSSNGEKWHFKSPAHAVDVIASQMLSKIGLTFQDADYQRLYDELPKNSKFAANLLDAFGKLSVFNAVADDIDIYRTLLELDPQNEDLAAAIQTHDGALAEGLVQEVVMDEHPDGTSGPITGGGKSDLLLGAKDQPSLVRGNKGDDTIVSGGGEDTLDGGTGGDTLYALADDTVIPGAGDDIVFLIDGYANVLPSDGDDIVFLPSTMEESSIINFDGGLTQVQVPGQDAFWLSDVEAIGFADGEVLRLPDQKSQVAYLNTDDTIGTNDFVVEFNLTLTDENLTSDLISFSHDGKNEMTIGVLEGRGLQFTLRSDATQYGTISFYDRSGTAAVSVGQEHNIKLVAYSSENASIDSHFRLFVDDKMISDGSILTKFSNGVVDRGRPFDLAKIDRVDVAKSGEVKDDGTVGPLGAFVSGVSLAKLGLNGPSSPIVFGEDALGISGPLFWVDKSGKRTEVFDGTSADLSIGELGIDNGRFILTPTDLDVLEDGQKFSESITLRAATGETVDLQFEVIGAAEPEPQPTPEYPDTLIPDEVETPLQPMLEVVRIAGNQNMRETSGNVPAELVPSAEDERVLVTKYGTLVIEPSGRWTWTSDQQALRSLGQDETFSLTHVLGGVEFQFDIVGLDDRPMTGGTSNTTLIVNDTNELTGSISIVDPDLSDNPSFAGARAGGQYGTAVVADDGNTFTYMIDFSVPAPVGNVFTEKLTFLASDGETKKTVQINLWSRGSMLEDHWGNGTEPDPQPTPEYPDFLVTDEVEPLARPELEVVRITGTQWLREASGRIDPSLVPSVAEDRVLVTDYGRLEIASNGPWTWTSDFDALRALDQGEAFNEAFVVGGVEFRFEIAGMEDPAQTGGVIYTHLQLDETNSVSGEITVFDPDAGDNPSFAGTVAEGKYGTAIVSTNGDLFTYTIDHSLSPPPGNHFTESLIFLADDGETSKPVTVNLYTQNGNFSDHWSNDEPAPVIGVDASDTGLF